MYTFVCGAAALWPSAFSVGARKGWNESPHYHPENEAPVSCFQKKKCTCSKHQFSWDVRYSFQGGGLTHFWKKRLQILGEFGWLSFAPWVIEILKGLEAVTWLAGGSPYIPKKLDK